VITSLNPLQLASVIITSQSLWSCNWKAFTFLWLLLRL